MTTMLSQKLPELIFGCDGLGNESLGEDAVAELLQTSKKRTYIDLIQRPYIRLQMLGRRNVCLAR